MKVRYLLMLLAVLILATFSGCFKAVPVQETRYAAWKNQNKVQDWKDLARFLERNPVVMHLHEYLSRQSWAEGYYKQFADSPFFASSIGSPPMWHDMPTRVDEFPVRLEMELGRKLKRLEYNELGLWAAWQMLAYRQGPRDWGSNLVSHRSMVMQAKWKNMGLQIPTRFRADSWRPRDPDVPMTWIRAYSPSRSHEEMAHFYGCLFKLQGKVHPLHAFFEGNLENCFHDDIVIKKGSPEDEKILTHYFSILQGLRSRDPKLIQKANLLIPKVGYIYNLEYRLAHFNRYQLDLNTISAVLNVDEWFQFLIKRPPRNYFVDGTGYDYYLPLLAAVVFDHLKIVKTLMEKDVYLTHDRNELLFESAKHGSHSVFEYLMAKIKTPPNSSSQGDYFQTFYRNDHTRECEECFPFVTPYSINEFRCKGPEEQRCYYIDAQRMMEIAVNEESVFSKCSHDLSTYSFFYMTPLMSSDRHWIVNTNQVDMMNPVDFAGIASHYEKVHVFYPVKTLLMIAAEYGREEMIKYLLKNGADVNAGAGGLSALSYAAKYDYIDIARHLLEAGARLEDRWEVEDEADVLKAFVGYSAACDTNPVLSSSKRIRTRWTYPQWHHPLVTAAREGHLEMVKLLLSRMTDARYAVIVSKALEMVRGVDVFEYPQIEQELISHQKRNREPSPALE